MKRLVFFMIIMFVFASSAMACKNLDTERSTYADASAATSNSAAVQPETESQTLIQNLDKVTDEIIRYAYENSPENIVIGSKYEGDFTGSGKPELLVIFKLLNTPHAGGLDCSVATVYDRASLTLITQKIFQYDECKFDAVKSEKNESYLLFAGSVTYQGYSQFSIGLWKPGKTWSNLFPSDPSYNDRKFELKGNGTVWVSRSGFTSPLAQEAAWLHEYNLVWNQQMCTLDESIPVTYKDSSGNPNLDAVSVSPDGRYAVVTQPSKRMVRIYDTVNNTLHAEFEMLAQEYGFLWSPDSKKVCVTRVARIWIESSMIEVEGKRAYDLPFSSDIISNLTAKGAKLGYELDKNRPDPYITPIEWSPDSLKVLMFFQWTDSKYNRQNGTFVFDAASGGISKITHNKAETEGGNIPAKKPQGFKW